MRLVVARLLVSTLLAGAFSLLVAGPASAAIRDPFQPLVTDTTTIGTTTTNPTQVSTTTPTTTQPVPTEPTPNTGWDPAPWLGLATLVLALGAGLLLFVRFLDPAALRIRR